MYKKFPLPEGKLTKLRASIVCEPSLVTFAMSLNMNELLLLGKGEEKTGGRERPSLIADAFESFVGALYLDKGIESVETFLNKVVYPHVIDDNYTANRDYKLASEFMHDVIKVSLLIIYSMKMDQLITSYLPQRCY